MSNISYNDKSQTAPYDASKWNAQDANEVKSAVNTHIADNANPHGVTKGQVGLGSVDNTSDASKPVSTAQAAAIAAKVDKTTTINGKALDTDITINKTDVGLSNVDNTSDVNKPLSTAAQSALNNKKDIDKYTSTAHGFAVGEAVYRDNTGWHRSSNADNTITSKVDGVVIIVPNADSFVLGRRGDKFLFSGVSGTNYFLGSGSPNYTTSETTTVGKIWQHLFTCDSATEATIILSDQYEIAESATSTISDDSVTNAKLAVDIKVGSLASLNTTNKASVVAAINEVKASIGSSSGVDRDYISVPPLSNPGSFTAVPDGDTIINLSWGDVSGEANYVIQRSTSQTSGYTTVNSPVADSNSYSDTGRSGSTTYYYRMKAIGNGFTTRDSEWVYANATTDVSAAVASYVKLNFTWTTYGISGWNDIYPADAFGPDNWAAGYVTFNDLLKSDGTASTIDISNGTGWVNYINGNSSGSGTQVFPDQVVERQWKFNNGATLNITGLTSGATYKFYIHSCTFANDGFTFTVAGITSSPAINTLNNYGSSVTYPNWEDDPALASVQFTATSSSETITLNCTGTSSNIDAMVIKVF